MRAALLALTLAAAAPAAAGPDPALMDAPSPVDCAGALCPPPDAVVADVAVSDAAGLARALRDARGGETIELAPGAYGPLQLAGRSFEPPLTLRSADPVSPARASGLELRDVRGLRLEGLAFEHDHPEGVHPKEPRPFRIRGGGDIEIVRSTFRGGLASGTGDPFSDGFPAGHGLIARGVDGLAVRGSLLTTLFRGAALDHVDGLVFAGNRVTAMRSDGLNLTGVRDALIEGNEIGDFRVSHGSPDHQDMIQFWSTRARRPSERVTIRGNLLHAGSGRATQSIFMRNEQVDKGQAGREMFYRDLTIEGNAIVNAHRHGITVGATLGLRVLRNTLVPLPSAAIPDGPAALGIPVIMVAPRSEDVAVAGNVAAALKGPEDAAARGWHVEGNVALQSRDPAAPGWWGGLLVDPPRDPRHRPDGPLRGAGAPLLEIGAPGEGGPIRPLIRIEALPGASGLHLLDAGLTTGLPEGARLLWRLPDGSSAEGVRIERALPPGVHEIGLSIEAPDGQRGAAAARVSVAAPFALSLDPQAGALVVGKERLALPGGAGPLVLGPDAPVPDLAGVRMAGLAGASEARIEMRLRAAPHAETGGSHGTVLSLGRGLSVSMDALGAIEVAMGGRSLVRTPPLRLHDGAWHEVAVALDGGRLSIEVDGTPRALADAPGALPATVPLRLGARGRGRGFQGEIDRLEITGGAAAPS